ncbi:tyrosine-type recombinase/integrase [Streptomyces sp. SM10]|uniref:tyrosine-type recombinase/integrase n=1 Tax=Streptomyces sp. SM10 TaxID=565556 RepID=UPI00215650C3|nr:tyrosine-type recombinase/integrase [Streptomyces sp. SM10]
MFPDTPADELKLLPSTRTNPHGTKAINSISEGHRTWVDSLPDFLVPTTVEENGQTVTRMLPFDKSRIFPYAYRHSYAQRHADAGVAPDVLKELMDHSDLKTTQNYYNPRELHPMGEKPQVAWSRREAEGLRRLCELAA